ncbi:MAG: hypothetical protein ACFBRM_10990 [Pikeienuella sp.]
MKMDNALNAQIEILKKVLNFKELGEGGEGPSDLVDPRLADVAKAAGRPRTLSAGVARPDGIVGLRSEASMRSTASPKTDSVTQDIAIGVSRRPNGKADDFVVSVIYQNRNLGRDSIMDRISSVAAGEVSVGYAGRVRALSSWHRTRIDPLQGGAGCGHAKITVGTLGFFAEDTASRDIGIVSNNHVLADVNSGEIGDPIRQPGRSDNGSAGDKVATLDRFVTIQFGGVANFLDCAWARLDTGRGVNPADIVDGAEASVGQIASNSPITLMPGDLVVKNGRTTNYTQGEVVAVNVVNLGVDMGGGLVARFDNQIRVETVNRNRFSDGGDSGSLILRNDFQPGGLLFAGSGSGGSMNRGMTFANPLADVLSALHVEMVI